MKIFLLVRFCDDNVTTEFWNILKENSVKQFNKLLITDQETFLNVLIQEKSPMTESTDDRKAALSCVFRFVSVLIFMILFGWIIVWFENKCGESLWKPKAGELSGFLQIQAEHLSTGQISSKRHWPSGGFIHPLYQFRSQGFKLALTLFYKSEWSQSGRLHRRRPQRCGLSVWMSLALDR